ncbi:ABC-three component system middle component 6 [Peptococcus simiae]|uniref:ABC-three component system middle component 6 n=1 Tax=Peptococcus simiae TaxID=1643805 RepID=UPI00397E9C1D
MLLPDNMQPELSIYYNGAVILSALSKKNNQKLLDLFQQVKDESNMSFSLFVLGLDWLYLLGAARITEGGEVQKCSLKA